MKGQSSRPFMSVSVLGKFSSKCIGTDTAEIRPQANLEEIIPPEFSPILGS